MGLKKIQNLFKDKKSKEQVSPALSLAAVKKENVKKDSIQDKTEVEAYIKSINSKLKDPKMAKKAAQILENWTKKN